MQPSSKTDWERVQREAAGDEPIVHSAAEPYDPNDATAVDAFWDTAVIRRRGERGQQKAPTKEQVSLRLSPEVVSYFNAGGQGWQTRLDQALKEYVQHHSSQ